MGFKALFVETLLVHATFCWVWKQLQSEDNFVFLLSLKKWEGEIKKNGAFVYFKLKLYFNLQDTSENKIGSNSPHS